MMPLAATSRSTDRARAAFKSFSDFFDIIFEPTRGDLPLVRVKGPRAIRPPRAERVFLRAAAMRTLDPSRCHTRDIPFQLYDRALEATHDD